MDGRHLQVTLRPSLFVSVLAAVAIVDLADLMPSYALGRPVNLESLHSFR